MQSLQLPESLGRARARRERLPRLASGAHPVVVRAVLDLGGAGEPLARRGRPPKASQELAELPAREPMPEGHRDVASITNPVPLDEVRGVEVERLPLGEAAESRQDLHSPAIGGVLFLSDHRARPGAGNLEPTVTERRVTELVTEDDPECVAGERAGAHEDPIVA